jgi:hypothetical protein
MDKMTTDEKLLAQDDIDALLGEAGVEGNYETKSSADNPHHNSFSMIPSSRFNKKSDDDVIFAISVLHKKAYLEREENIKVIWNASGTIPMASGFNLNIQERDYVSLGILHETHLVVKELGI